MYLAEVKNTRVDGKVVQKFIRYVGREADGKNVLSCSISDVEINCVKLSGPLMVLHAIAENIELPKILGKHSNEILSMVYAHCLDFKSLNHMQRWFKRTDLNLILNLADLTERPLVNALDVIESIDLMNVQKKIFDETKSFLKIQTKGMVYDVTNTYFHGSNCSIAKYGHDKENRKGSPLIQIGLAVTQEFGIPIFHKKFPGNIHDARTFLDVSNDLSKFGITSGIAVMDRGIGSASNSAFLDKMKWKILCGLKADEGIKVFLGNKFIASDLCKIKKRIRFNKSVFYCEERPFKHGNVDGRPILCFNKKKAYDAAESRLDEIQEAKIRREQKKTIKTELIKFFGANGTILESKINEDSTLDGMSFIFTTSDLSAHDALKSYFDKYVVEKSFQTLKGVVRLRTVRHWLYNRVEAHVFICYLSCLLLSILKIKVSPLEMSFQNALQEMEALYRVYLRDPKTGFKLGRMVALTKKQEKIIRAIDKRLIKKCSE